MEPNFALPRREFPPQEHKGCRNSGSYSALANKVKAAFEACMEDRLTVGANWDVWMTKNAVRSRVVALPHAAPDEIATTASVSAGLNALASVRRAIARQRPAERGVHETRHCHFVAR
jgi:hypothetical protein